MAEVTKEEIAKAVIARVRSLLADLPAESKIRDGGIERSSYMDWDKTSIDLPNGDSLFLMVGTKVKK